MVLLYGLGAALLVSAVSLIGILAFLKDRTLHGRFTHALLALAAGAMLGNAVLHLLPHALSLESEFAIVQQIEHKAEADHVGHQAHDQSHDGHDHDAHGEHEGHNHHVRGEHEGHDHDAHDEHKGHDHHAEHEGHDHEEHHAPTAVDGHDAHHDESHDGHGHDSHAGHDHAGHGHTGLYVAFLILGGLLGFHVLDTVLSRMTAAGSIRSEGWLVLVGDAIENFLDGMVLGATFLISVPLGIAATITVLMHEVPLELGDYAVLRHSGFSRGKALLANLASGLVSMIGVAVAILLGTTFPAFTLIATAVAAGAFIYIAGSLLIPLVRTKSSTGNSALYLSMTTLGVILMALLLLIE